MRSIVYAGNDFSEICSAEVVERAANPIVAEAMAVPGRAGALLVSGYIPPVDVRVRLFMDMGYNPGFTGMAQMRGKVRRWLSWPGGGSLVLPDDPEVEYRDAMLVGASDWSNLFEAGECTLTFTLFDPIDWGAERVERTSRFEVDVAVLDGDDADLGDTVAVIDTSRDPEWRLTARVVRRVRTFGEQVVARVTIGTVEPVDYAQVSALAADVATLRDDVVGIDGNLTTAASVTVVENTVTTAIDDLDF